MLMSPGKSAVVADGRETGSRMEVRNRFRRLRIIEQTRSDSKKRDDSARSDHESRKDEITTVGKKEQRPIKTQQLADSRVILDDLGSLG